jgi:hypothetical protein
VAGSGFYRRGGRQGKEGVVLGRRPRGGERGAMARQSAAGNGLRPAGAGGRRMPAHHSVEQGRRGH